MRTRWVFVFAMVAALGLALAAAATSGTSKAVAPEAVTASPVTAQPVAVEPADPYLEATEVSTEATAGKSCSIYAGDCIYNGGPCGPNGACHCLFDPASGWICGR